MEPVMSNPPGILGLPAGFILVAFAGGMAVFGWFVARRAQTLGIALGALAFLTTPALLLLVMAPALVLFLIEKAS
jgi:hypothetical protein